MFCEVCGKKEATVHLTEIINDKVTKLNLCEGGGRRVTIRELSDWQNISRLRCRPRPRPAPGVLRWPCLAV